jgi:hypothetical protein
MPISRAPPPFASKTLGTSIPHAAHGSSHAGTCGPTIQMLDPLSSRAQKIAPATPVLETPLHLHQIQGTFAKLLISFLDHTKESHSLSFQEFTLRRIIISSLQRTIREKVAFWRQRSKIKFTIDGDENTKYFHALATSRYMKNKIAVLEVNGTEFSSHDHKMQILTSFYQQLLGQEFEPVWNFSLSNLYPTHTHGLSNLGTPFLESKIVEAFFNINFNASPGPDGFGPGFYKKFQSLTKPKIFNLFNQFFNVSLDTTSINRAHLILIPKSDGARSPKHFRPISLHNCPIKAISKLLANRLQKIIPSLIHGDQTGFVQGRSISKKITYAAYILNYCHKRKAPAMVFKLDFRKAFDSVS